MAAGGSTRVVLAALLANTGIAITKGFAAVVTGSSAMLAETVHSVADAGNQALLLLGAKRARRPPDARHPFGYASEQYFWAFVVALVLFALGSLFSLYEGFHKLGHPAPLENAGWAYAVLLIALVLETLSFFVARKEVKKARGDRSFLRFFRESRAPALSLVYLEDLGAVLGLIFALIGVYCSDRLGWHAADGVASILVGLVLGAIACALLYRCHKLLVGESATEADLARIRAAAAAVDGVEEIVDLKTLHFGPETLIVVIDVRAGDAAGTAKAIERAVMQAVPIARYVAVEQQTPAGGR